MTTNTTTRRAAQALGIYAGLIALEHGVYEILQGNVAPGGVMINAIGPPCRAEAAWHGCLPAITVLPSFLAAGVLTVVTSCIAIIWSIAFVQRKRGGMALILLSIMMLLIGGGFVAPFIGLIAGAAGTRINTPLRWWRTWPPDRALRVLAALWPWPLIAIAVWLPSGLILGQLFNQAMLRLVFLVFFVFDLALPLLAALSGLARDARRRGPAGSAASSRKS